MLILYLLFVLLDEFPDEAENGFVAIEDGVLPPHKRATIGLLRTNKKPAKMAKMMC